MDCWLASFPRSGNTYFRNILYYVYGIESSTWHKETAYGVDENYDRYQFVKTHLLPGELLPDDPSIPAIYIVRDGRDAVVSIAHHRSDLVQPGSDFDSNLLEAIVAEEGSFFGGWSKNVNEWIQRAQLLIRYEDLIADPVAVFKRVEKLIPLPPPAWDKLPGFEEMKKGKPMYGGVSKITDPKFNPEEFAGKFFRKGKSGGWKEEMPPHVQDLFWNHHGAAMERLGYASYPGSVGQNALLDYTAMQKLGMDVPQVQKRKYSIYIEATKVVDPLNDGIKRYVEHLLDSLQDVVKIGMPQWEFKLFIERKIFALENYQEEMRREIVESLHPYEKVLMAFKNSVRKSLPEKMYLTFSSAYKKTGARKYLKLLQKTASLSRMKSFYKQLLHLKDNIDLLHIPLPQNAEFFEQAKHSFLVTVHDLTHKLYPEFHEKVNIDLAEKGMQFILEKKAEVLAVSKNTILDLTKNYPVDADKINLVYESPDPDLFKWNVNKGRAAIIRKKYDLGATPYFLCLSTIEPRKNLPNTIRAFNQFSKENPQTEINLVISGNAGWKTEHLSEELHLDNPRIIFTGYVEDYDLPVIYSEAYALVYVSFYEGFGLPPLEAMSCRTPVIYGDNSSMKEVIGDAGLPAIAGDVNSIKEQMGKIFFDKNLRDTLAVKSHHRSFEYSSRRMIYDTLMVYGKILRSKDL